MPPEPKRLPHWTPPQLANDLAAKNAAAEWRTQAGFGGVCGVTADDLLRAFRAGAWWARTQQRKRNKIAFAAFAKQVQALREYKRTRGK